MHSSMQILEKRIMNKYYKRMHVDTYYKHDYFPMHLPDHFNLLLIMFSWLTTR